ncbi:hypothetical protein [Mesorhizobium mediterraneum]|uniref:hypothetical protein n=1 Tax=Mesorhizobium mediterraneum TaxID=43617 RepID=UPI00177D2667|nr:hypothetical protein [Mesorhizobium mediterraneum]
MSEGHYSKTQEALAESLPAAPSIPEDLDWKAFGFGLAEEVLSFMTSLRLVESEATDAKVFEQNPFDFDDAVKLMGCSLRGPGRAVLGVEDEVKPPPPEGGRTLRRGRYGRAGTRGTVLRKNRATFEGSTLERGRSSLDGARQCPQPAAITAKAKPQRRHASA